MKPTKIVITFIVAAISPESGSARQKAEFQTTDRNTVLLIDGDYFYLGPSLHPEEQDFVRNYGFRIKTRNLIRGKCLSLGVIKIAEYKGHDATCKDVHIYRSYVPKIRGLIRYEASCKLLIGNGCDRKRPYKGPAFRYSYEIDGRRGVTVIYLAGIGASNQSNTLRLRGGALLLR